MKFNLSRFKKIAADEHKTVLQHPMGHKIEITHDQLKPHIRKQLDALPLHAAQGAFVPEEDAAPEQPKEGPQQNPQDSKFSELMTQMQGRPVFDPKMGTTVFPQEGRYKDAVTNAALGQLQTEAQSEQAAQDKARVGMERDQENALQQVNQYKQAGVTPPVEIAAKANMVIPSSYGGGQGPSNYQLTSAAAPGSGATPPATQAQDPFGAGAYLENVQGGVGLQRTGILGEAIAQQTQAHLEQQAANNQALEAQKLLTEHRNQENLLNNEIASVRQDIRDGHIDPNQFINKMGVGQKISTAIGIILGGMGSALAGGENPALKFLQNQVENNINAQTSELGKKQNLLQLLIHQQGNVRNGTEMLRAINLDHYSSLLKAAAATAVDPMSKARALQAAGQLDMQVAPILSQLAMRKTLTSGTTAAGVDPALKVRFLVDEKEQPAAYKELQAAQNMGKQRDAVLSAFDQLTHVNKLSNRVLSPIQSSKQVALLREPLLAQLVKDSEGRITPQDTEMIRPLFPAVGDDAGTLYKKRIQLSNFINQKMHFPILDAHGITLPAGGGKMNFNVPANYKPR